MTDVTTSKRMSICCKCGKEGIYHEFYDTMICKTEKCPMISWNPHILTEGENGK